MAQVSTEWDGVNVLAWNCYGINGKETSQHLYELKKQRKLKIIFLCETKLQKGEAEHLRATMSLTGCLEVPARGQNGGLALLWESFKRKRVSRQSSPNRMEGVQTENGESRVAGN